MIRKKRKGFAQANLSAFIVSLTIALIWRKPPNAFRE